MGRRGRALVELTWVGRCKQALVELTWAGRRWQALVELTWVGRRGQALVELTRVGVGMTQRHGVGVRLAMMTCEEWAWWQDKVSQNAFPMSGYRRLIIDLLVMYSSHRSLAKCLA